MKIKLSVLSLLALSFLNLTLQSCSNSNTTPRGTISIGINGNGSGCTVISYLDGSNPVTMATNGSFTAYPGVSNATHSVSIFAPSIGSSGTCSFTINNDSHIVGVYNPCGSGTFSTSCN